MMEFIEPTDLDLDGLFRQLGIADYTYIQTASFMERLEQYRSELLTRIEHIHGNGKSVDTSAGLCESDLQQTAN